MEIDKIKLALDTKFESMDLGEVTLREYLKNLLSTLIEKEESFGGKRPFGNSGWIYDPITALIMAGAIDGELDADGGYENCDMVEAKAALQQAIELM